MADSREGKQKTYGIVVATVTDNKHPDGDYCVKVKYPTTSDSSGESGWARCMTFGAGVDRGTFWLPEINDEVLVAFQHGDFDSPLILGSVWNGVDKTIYDNGGDKGKAKWAAFHNTVESGKNDLRVLASRTGHQLMFNDNAKGSVVLHSSKKHRLVFDQDKDTIQLYDGTEDNYVLIDAKNKKITIETKTGEMLFKAKTKIRFECENMETKTDKDCKLDIGANYEMKAASNMTIKASGSGDIESSGTMTFKGATVNIN